MSCHGSIKKEDHTWEYFDEPKIYIVDRDGQPTAVATIAECTECGTEMVREETES